jgi:hypothetical protein
MGYYVRALLTEWHERPLRELIDHSRAYGHELRPERPDETPLDDPSWRDADLLGPGAQSPIEVEVAVDDGAPDGMVPSEVQELGDELEEADGPPEAIARVRDHLSRTKAIVAVRILASDSDLGAESAAAVLHYYAQREGVLFQADDDGFYDGDELIVRT